MFYVITIALLIICFLFAVDCCETWSMNSDEKQQEDQDVRDGNALEFAKNSFYEISKWTHYYFALTIFTDVQLF